MTDNPLPELPEEGVSPLCPTGYTADQLTAYGQQCYAAGIAAVIAAASRKGWAMKNEDAFEDSVREVAEEALSAIRKP
jgi:hypothetical protein